MSWAVGMVFGTVLTGCSLINEDQSDCGEEVAVDYEIRLVTNMSIELTTKLGTDVDACMAAALRRHLSGIFTDHANDIDLSFYDTAGDSARLHHEQHVMDASQQSYTIQLPKRDYMHLALANVRDNQQVTLEGDDRCHQSSLSQAASADTISPHNTGLFTARQPISVREGEILSLLGENGSGKTTLMNMLSGVYYPDEGEILIDGRTVNISSPKDAFDLGIGMIHQHFKLIDVFTALENILIGLPKENSEKTARTRIKEICDRYGFELDPDKKIYDMNVSEKETLEIVKTLYRGAEVLILDEPTAVLTPQEIRRLFMILRNMKEDGKAIVIITHKLNEVMEISDRISVLRKGENVGTVLKSQTNEQQLTEMMVGEKISLNIARDLVDKKAKRLEVKHLTVLGTDEKKAVDDISFDLYSGEILGIAGISGSGQKELLEAIMGLQKCEEGSSVIYNSTAHGVHELVGLSTKEIIAHGLHLAFVPEDRLGMGLVGNMGMTDNVMLKRYRKGDGPFLHRKQPEETAKKIKDELEVLTPDLNYPVRRLSGGNVQKILVGREINNKPTVLMTAYAVRGLDINTSYAIYNLLNEQKKKGHKVIMIGDGINDAPSIMRSDVGFAMGAIGSDIAVQNADVVIMNDNPAKVYESVKIARIARHTAIFNIIFALAVKAVVAILVLIFGNAIPMAVPVIADTGLTVLLVLNSLLILYRKVSKK